MKAIFMDESTLPNFVYLDFRRQWGFFLIKLLKIKIILIFLKNYFKMLFKT